MIKKLYPKCINGQKPPALTAKGYFLPCCWCDIYKVAHEFSPLMKEHLNINNVTDIRDIFYSEEWDEFFRILKEDPDSAPSVCKFACSSHKHPFKKATYFKKASKDNNEK